LFEPVIGGVIGWLWTGDIYLGAWTIVGGCLMLAGAMLVKFEEANEQTTDESPS
jgi:drug/metabolite transporter (DMT)-like permease